jgi:hypothetical protein
MQSDPDREPPERAPPVTISASGAWEAGRSHLGGRWSSGTLMFGRLFAGPVSCSRGAGRVVLALMAVDSRASRFTTGARGRSQLQVAHDLARTLARRRTPTRGAARWRFGWRSMSAGIELEPPRAGLPRCVDERGVRPQALVLAQQRATPPHPSWRCLVTIGPARLADGDRDPGAITTFPGVEGAWRTGNSWRSIRNGASRRVARALRV